MTLGIVEGNDWGWTSVAMLGSFAASGLAAAGVIARSRTHPRPIVEPRSSPMAPSRSATSDPALRRRLLLADPWKRPLPHFDLGLHRAPGRLRDAARADPLDGRRRARGPLADRFGHRAVIVPGTLFFAVGVTVLRSAGAEPDWLGLWLPGSCLTGIGIGLAFPTLGAAAVRDVPVDRFATASAVNAAFRQVGAVLGTAILVAIVGEPRGPRRSPQRLQRRLRLRHLRLAGLWPRGAGPASSSESQALSAVPTPTVKLRSPAATSIVLPPTSPISVAPSASSASRSPLSRKPPGPSPNRASSGEQPRSRSGCRSTRQPRPAGDRALGQGAGEAAVADVVGGGELPGADRVADGSRRPRSQR